MQYEANSTKEYIEQLPPERSQVIKQLRKIILEHLPLGFQEQLSYGMLGFVVPHAEYPQGYHVNPSLPLPFIHLASQKKFVALYHMGIYADQKVLEWFKAEFPKHSNRKLDMGKSCIRFKYLDDIPYKLIAELCTKMTVDHWIRLYEKNTKK
jgi:uncharacterized protein YdhG (YjbR/CyaY superfamily)